MYEDLVERLREYFDRSIWGLPSDILQAADAIETLESKLYRLKRERDQAVKDLHHNNACEICIGFNEQECCDCECLDCTLECRCKNCRDENLWQWRGVQEER